MIWAVVAMVLLGAWGGAAGAQDLPGDLLEQLREGGYVLVMRHAHAPAEPPAPADARPDNVRKERQLSPEGRAGAAALGDALRRLAIPVEEVLSSPAYRAVETATVARLAPIRTVEELGDGGQSMRAVGDAEAVWLRLNVAERPAAGNRLLVTHQPNLARAFPDWAPGVAEGETMVLRPNGRGSFDLLARIPIEAWSRLR